MAKKNGTLKIIAIIVAALITVGIAAASAVLRYGRLNHQVADNMSEITEMRPQCLETEKAVIGIQKDVEHISGEVDEIKVMQRQILEEVRK